jgi:hypothetical protein
MRAGFEIVSRNQPSYRPRITRIEVSVLDESISVLGELVRLYNAPPRRTGSLQAHRSRPVDQQLPGDADRPHRRYSPVPLSLIFPAAFIAATTPRHGAPEAFSSIRTSPVTHAIPGDGGLLPTSTHRDCALLKT